MRDPSALWKAWKFLFSILMLAGVLYYAHVFRNMWREVMKQTVNSERAWIGLKEPVTIDVLELTPRLKVEAHYSIQNFGHGPALKVTPSGWFLDDSKTLKTVANGICRGAEEFSTGTVPLGSGLTEQTPMGFMLFQGQFHTETIGSPRDPWQGAAEPDLKHFWFVGCIAYIDQFKNTRWTRFCMEPAPTQQPITRDIPLRYCPLYNDTEDTR